MTTTHALAVDYTDSSLILANSSSLTSRRKSGTKSSYVPGRKKHKSKHGGGFGLIFGVLILVVIVVAVVLFLRRRASR